MPSTHKVKHGVPGERLGKRHSHHPVLLTAKK